MPCYAQSLSHGRLFATPGIAACQAPLSMEFSRQKYWSGLPCPPPGDLPNPGVKPRSPTMQADSLPSEPAGKPMNNGVSSTVVCVSLDAFHTIVINCVDSDCNFLINDVWLYNLNQATFIILNLSFFMSTLRSLFPPCRSEE